MLIRYDTLLIGGEWVRPHSGRMIASIDPSTEEVWAEVAEADETDVAVAVEAAREAMRGPWRTRIPASQRGVLLHRLADLMRRDASKLAEIESRDNGKTFKDTLGEVQRAADWLVYFAGAADKIHGEEIPFRPGAHAYSRREPIGVVSAILPWNSPILLASWKLGPALAAGNAIILKPAELTPVSTMELGRLAVEAGFPAGVVNVVPGYGNLAGAALTSHPGVNKISFTGEHRTAQEIMRSAATTLKRLTFECGGKAPHIIFADADLDRALSVAVHSAFRSTGQSCSLGSRVFVERPVYEQMVDRVAARAERIRVGMPMESRSHIGPQTSAEQLAKTERYIQLGRDQGARLVTGGTRPTHLDKGYFIAPTVFADVDNRSRLAQEEIFGPVLAMIPFDSEDEVIAMANDVQYGLVGGLWTNDLGRAFRVAEQIEAGTVTVNTFRPAHWMLPYGGYKLSGIGRENGLEVLNHYTEVKTIVMDFAAEVPADPFAS